MAARTYDTLQGKQLVGATPGALFGSAVATGRDLVAVGAPYDNFGAGAAYLYTCDSANAGPCSSYANLTGTVPGGLFGWSVHVHEGYVVVGAPGAQRAYRFNCGTPACALTATLQELDTLGEPDWFGWAVADSGTHVAVGAWNHTDVNISDGLVSAFVCDPVDGSCAYQGSVIPAAPTGADHFGHAVTIDGGIMAVGAYAHNYGRGGVFLYTCDVTSCGEDALPLLLSAPDGGMPGDYFGDAIALDNGVLAVGARGARAAYIYDCASAAACTFRTSVVGPDATAAWFGWTVALAGSTLAVGSFDERNSNGTVYLYDCPDTCTLTGQLEAASPMAAQQLGKAVDLNRATGLLVVGADQYETVGAAYVYYGTSFSNRR